MEFNTVLCILCFAVVVDQRAEKTPKGNGACAAGGIDRMSIHGKHREAFVGDRGGILSWVGGCVLRQVITWLVVHDCLGPLRP